MNKGNVVVALSGGVDSSVAAALLLEEGYQVQGIFMKNWSPHDQQSLTDCPWEQDQADAEAVCAQLGIPFRSVNFEREYREKVVEYLLSEYAAGRTPNPDVLCNKEIKFAAFLEVAFQEGADFIATGHYVQRRGSELYRGYDPNKDQSYFLYTLREDQLRRALFPIGGLEKSAVRKLAAQYGLVTAEKKDSQGICFIGELNLKDYLQSELGRQPGELLLLPPYHEGQSSEVAMAEASVVGTHLGTAYHTIGERMGPYLDNRRYVAYTGQHTVPSTFVVSKDIEKNKVFISDSKKDPRLYTNTLVVENMVRTGENPDNSTIDAWEAEQGLTCQIRYRQEPVSLEKIEVQNREKGVVVARLSDSVWAAAAGQSVVMYQGTKVVGGGVLCGTH